MNREVRVGLMFIISLAILGASLYFLGSFQEMVKYKIKFDKVIGLAVDSPVHFNGVPIGRVSKIVLSEETQQPGQVPIIVTIKVHRSARNHIRHSTEADIKSVGILGDKSILLITRDYTADLLEEGAFIHPSPKMVDVEKLLAQGTDMVTDITAVTENLKKILDQLANEDGVLQRLISDTELADELKATVRRAAAYLENEDSVAGLLLKDPAFAADLKSRVTTISANVAAISEQFREGEGLVPALMTDKAYKQEVQKKINHMLDSTTAYVETLSESRGLLYKLTRDEEYGLRISQNLEKASYHLASILEKIDEGEGTASLVVNDPSLYQGIYEVVYGLQHSGVSKWYLRKKQKKGAKLKAREEEKKEEESQ